MSCKHLTASDHVTVPAQGDRPSAWRCSVCGTSGRWTDGWLYFGNVECGRCQRAQVDRVLCPACAKRDVRPEQIEGWTDQVHA